MNDKKGFTIVELLAVILIIGILMVIAVPSIMGANEKIKDRSLNSKIDSIQEAAVVYAQNNANKIKSKLGGICTEDTEHCVCHDILPDGTKTNCQYKFTITVDELIELGAYTSEKKKASEEGCDVKDPRDPSICLDCVPILVHIDDDYKSAFAKMNKEDVKDKTATCTEKSAILK